MLKLFAKLILRRYKPLVIGVAGSVGKTTTIAALDAIFTANGKRVRTTPPTCDGVNAFLTAILGVDLTHPTLLKRFLAIARANQLLFLGSRKYPNVLLLEYCIRSGGMMKELLGIAKPRIGILTSFAPINLAGFGSSEKLVRELTMLIRDVPANGWAILPADDGRSRDLKSRIPSRVITFGLSEEANVRAVEIQVTQKQEGKQIVIDGTQAKFTSGGSAVPVFLKGVLGGPHIHAGLAASAAAVADGTTILAAANGLKTYAPPPGRMRLLRGIKKTLIVDDTYNASHVSCVAALSAGTQIKVEKPQESFAVIGDLVHLGGMSHENHEQLIGEDLVQSGLDYIITVGKDSANVGKFAREAGMPEANIYHFDTSEEAGQFLKGRLEEGDVVFVTGRRETKMEEVVRDLLAQPDRAGELLVSR